MILANGSDMLMRQDVSFRPKCPNDFVLNAPAPEIFVVDDMPEVRELIAAILRGAGYRVRTAEGGEAAFELLAAATPALVISDLQMPLGSGWDLLMAVQLNWPHVPVLLMTSGLFGQHPEIERWAAARLPKPLSPARLLSEVDSLVRLRVSKQNPNPAGLTPRGPAG